MEYINLGKSDLKVSRICLGCMNKVTHQNGFIARVPHRVAGFS